MKIFIISFLILIIIPSDLSRIAAQSVAINNTGAAPDANAVLDVDISTNNKGILIPRLTTAQVNLMGSVTKGMFVFNETINDFQYYNGTSWVIIGNSYISNKIQDSDTDTKIQVEETTDEDKIRFDIAGTEKMILDNIGLGIGTTVPSAKLDVVGSFKLTNGTQGINKYLKSDASGNASWTSDLIVPGSLTVNIRTISAATTVLDSDNVLICNASGGGFTVTLPTAVGRTGRLLTFKKLGSANTVTIDAYNDETIDGGLTSVLTAKYKSVRIVSNGIQWYILGGF